MSTVERKKHRTSKGRPAMAVSRLLIATGFALAGTAGWAVAGPGKTGHHHGAKEEKTDTGHDHGKMDHGKMDHGKMDHGKMGHGAMDHSAMPGGQPGKASEVDRKIEIVATDIKFDLKSIEVKDGETIHFVIKNTGALVHEFTIGPPDMQKAHQAEMLKMMESGKLEADRIVDDGGHSHPNTVLIGPKETKEIIWKFAKAESLEFGCNIPGHYEAGMKGPIQIKGS